MCYFSSMFLVCEQVRVLIYIYHVFLIVCISLCVWQLARFMIRLSKIFSPGLPDRILRNVDLWISGRID